MKERVAIHIDGGNFYHLALKKLRIKETQFDFDAFALFLANSRSVAELGKRYYVGTVREREGDAKSRDAMAEQTRLFSALKSAQWEVKTSKLRERREKLIIDRRVEDSERIRGLGITEIRFLRNREKGIDVKLVTDLFIGAIDDQFDTAIIVSSDTDLVPAIDSLRRRLKKKVEYVGFSIADPDDPNNPTTPLLSMIPRTDIQRTLVESDLRRFVK